MQKRFASIRAGTRDRTRWDSLHPVSNLLVPFDASVDTPFAGTSIRRQAMARVSTCLCLPRSTEAAFLFYKTVFGSGFLGPLMRFRDTPPCDG